MPVYSKIQQLRDERRREQKRKWKEKQPKSAKKKSETQAAIQKRKQREKVAIIKKNEEKKRADATQRKRKSRLALTKKHELEKMLVDTARQRKTERHRRWREKKHNGSVVTYPIDTGETRNEFTFNKMSKCRAIKKLKCALPRTPVKRVATVKAYLSCKKSPTVQELQTKGRSFTGGNQGCKIK